MVTFTVNGSVVDIAAPDDKPLLWALREDLGFLGPKYGCGVAQCGACRVLADGRSTPFCAISLGEAAGASVVTRGIAIKEAFRSIVAQIVEVTVGSDGEITVDWVFCAIDVGIAVNPDAVIAQMEGSISYGLTTALMSAITIENGAVVESNFHDYPMHRLHNAPDVTVEIMDSHELPGGAGEPGVVPVAAGLANAIFDATGRRLRSLPLAVTETVDEGRTRTVLPESRA
jgi:CO/xanthine dehydrogenase Mo-binding subunit